MPPRFLRSPSRGGFSYAANVGEYGFCELRLLRLAFYHSS
jgi:hypothetical protein